ncbi:hypothetical protein [Rhabdaerophilum sp.]|uniref:hypothetical protein n=1 Tax=Rhabdaerophilum sp. TaxID=2717341 RepID=UPI0038D3A6F8
MTVSPDDAREALAFVEAAEQRVRDVGRRRGIGPGLLAFGTFGLVGFGLQSRLSELWFGTKLISGFSGVMILLVCLLASVWIIQRVHPPISLKQNVCDFFLPALAALVAGWLEKFFRTHGAMPDISATAGLVGFLVGIFQLFAVMLWLGRWYAVAVLPLILSIAGILAYEPVMEIRFAYLALLCGFVLMPAGVWLILKDRRI